MSICHSCNGVIGRDCWNPQECAEITERMAMESSCQAAPSQTPEAAGLEVVAWLTTGGDTTRSEAYANEQSVNDPANYPVALVTAASAQAAIDAEKARADRAESRIAELAVLFGVCDGGRYLNDWKARADRATAAEARAARLAKALERIADRPGPGTTYTKGIGEQPVDEAAHMASIATEALQQETRP